MPEEKPKIVPSTSVPNIDYLGVGSQPDVRKSHARVRGGRPGLHRWRGVANLPELKYTDATTTRDGRHQSPDHTIIAHSEFGVRRLALVVVICRCD